MPANAISQLFGKSFFHIIKYPFLSIILLTYITQLVNGSRHVHQLRRKMCGEAVSVAVPGCLSRILIFTHPGSLIQKQQQKRGVKKI
jgi:hypothetical protein